MPLNWLFLNIDQSREELPTAGSIITKGQQHRWHSQRGVFELLNVINVELNACSLRFQHWPIIVGEVAGDVAVRRDDDFRWSGGPK